MVSTNHDDFMFHTDHDDFMLHTDHDDFMFHTDHDDFMLHTDHDDFMFYTDLDDIRFNMDHVFVCLFVLGVTFNTVHGYFIFNRDIAVSCLSETLLFHV